MNERGFTMVEILVSAVVAGLLATSGFYFLSGQNQMGLKGTDLMHGVNLGKLKLDSLKVAAYDSLVSGADTVSERFLRTWHVTLMRDGGGVPNGLKKIEMTVMWPLTADHTVTFTSLKSDDRYKENN